MSNNTNNSRPTDTNMYGGWDGGYDSYVPSAFSGPFTLRPFSNRSEAVLGPTIWPPFGERITPPFGYASFPLRPHFAAGVLVRGDSLGRGATRSRPRPLMNQNAQTPGAEGNSMLSEHEQKEVLKKLKKEIYKPKEINSNPARMISRVGQYYKGNLSNIYEEGTRSNDREKCVICLEEFETREEIALTPCNHMFHEECIVPWAKRHGKCPVCRFAFCEKPEANQLSQNIPNAGSSDVLMSDLMSIIRAMDDAFLWERFDQY